MDIIDSIAHPNVLTEVDNDYYLLPKVRGTLTVDDIIGRLRDREIATKNVDGKAFIGTFLNECIAASAQGYNINTPFFRSSVSIQGTVYSEDLGTNVSGDRVKVSVNLEQGEEARRTMSNATVYIFEQEAPAGPAVKTVRCPQEAEPHRLPLGGMVMIEGKRLAVRGTAAGLGVIFEKADGSGEPVTVTPDRLSPNMPALLQFILPATVTAGEWRVKVCTQYGSGGALTKEARTSEYYRTVTVFDPADSGEGGGGDDVLE